MKGSLSRRLAAAPRVVLLLIGCLAQGFTIAQTFPPTVAPVANVLQGASEATNLDARQSRDASRFERQYGHEGGAAVIHEPFGGAYVYSQGGQSDGRMVQHLVLGRVPRTEFVLFSAEEELALWNLREKQRRDIERALEPVLPIHHAPRPQPVAINWPKVIVEGATTCVPETPFADQPDWASHLVCLNGATAALEHRDR